MQRKATDEGRFILFKTAIFSSAANITTGKQIPSDFVFPRTTNLFHLVYTGLIKARLVWILWHLHLQGNIFTERSVRHRQYKWRHCQHSSQFDASSDLRYRFGATFTSGMLKSPDNIR
jgi:hypothetical protein